MYGRSPRIGLCFAAGYLQHRNHTLGIESLSGRPLNLRMQLFRTQRQAIATPGFTPVEFPQAAQAREWQADWAMLWAKSRGMEASMRLDLHRVLACRRYGMPVGSQAHHPWLIFFRSASKLAG
jgi:hypothetical protein